MAVGGDITEITYSHPTLGSGVIFPKAAEDSTYDLGGFRSGDDVNMVDGGGNMITQLSRARWSFEVLCTADMVTAETIEAITAMAGSTELAEWTFSNINGTIYAGTGQPVGDVQMNGNASSFTLKVAGGGKLTKQ